MPTTVSALSLVLKAGADVCRARQKARRESERAELAFGLRVAVSKEH